MKYFDHLVSYIRENPKTYLVSVSLGSLNGLFELVGIASILPAIALMLGETNTGAPSFVTQYVERVGPTVIVAIYFVTILMQAGVAFAAEAYFLREMAKWRTKLSIDYVSNLMAADFSEICKLNPGEAELIITRNVGYAVRNRHRTSLFLTDVVLAVFYSLIAFIVSPPTFILFVLLGGIYGLMNRRLTDLRVEFSKKSNEKYLKSAKLLAEYLTDFRGLQSSNKRMLENELEAELFVAGEAQKSNDIINAGIRLISQPIMLVLLVVGVLVSKFTFDIANAQILVMLYVFYRASPKLISLARGYGEIIQDSPVDVTPEILRWGKMRRVINSEPAVASDMQGIEFKNVSFQHGETPILENVDLTIKPGELVALIGRSGSGKSTLLDLLCGFTRPDKGEIRAWGRDPALTDYSDWLLPDVSLLRPESVIISGTVASNVALLDAEPDRARIQQLVSRVGIGDILGSQGIDMPIDTRGGNLSAGQRQRILIARSLYKSPSLLILDEPTSNLDARTEQDINTLLSELKSEVTMLVVSHRDQLLEQADRVYRVKNRTLTLEKEASTTEIK